MSQEMAAIAPRPRITPSKSWSVTGWHELTIESYAATKGVGVGRPIPSCPFTVGGHQWKIAFFPDGENPTHAQFVGVDVELISSHPYDPLHGGGAGDGTEKEVVALFGFQLLDGIGRPISMFLWSNSLCTFVQSRPRRCFPKFMLRSKLEACPFLRRGSSDLLVIRCSLSVYCSYPSPTPVLPSPSVSKSYYHLHNISSLHEHLSGLLEAGHASDITLTAGNKTFKAHRCVLIARSPVFKTRLQQLPSGSDFKVEGDIDSETFKSLLHFLYTDTLPSEPQIGEGSDNNDSILKMHRLLAAADRYGMDKLKLICEDTLCENITLAMAGQTLTLAEKHKCPRLKALTIDFMTKFATDARKSCSQSGDLITPPAKRKRLRRTDASSSKSAISNSGSLRRSARLRKKN